MSYGAYGGGVLPQHADKLAKFGHLHRRLR